MLDALSAAGKRRSLCIQELVLPVLGSSILVNANDIFDEASVGLEFGELGSKVGCVECAHDKRHSETVKYGVVDVPGEVGLAIISNKCVAAKSRAIAHVE